MRGLLIPWLVLLLCAFTVQADEFALFTVDVNLKGAGVDSVNVRVVCGPSPGLDVRFEIPVDSTRTFTVPTAADGEISCVLTASPVPGQKLTFLGDGGSVFEADGPGCRFSGVGGGHSNFCQIQVENKETRLTVFKHWIGTSKAEEDVAVSLDCGRGLSHPTLSVNKGKPAEWSLVVNDEDGFLCSVSEAEGESYTSDVSDCEALLILPGAEEECTVVNTKVVKMIEVFNRYGLAVMILAFMVVGGFAARRVIP
ncbi:MAG: hypothetical protein KJN78_00480 [Gammaproteobacteria bacterium]|nr:hypothetical protein [Gammaproteobacteria bacterium]